MFSSLLTATSVVLAATVVSAQTFTECDPTKTSTCKPDPALGGSIDIDFRNGANDFFTPAQGTQIAYDKTSGAVFTINKVSDAPTIVSSKYIFYGKVEVVVQASQGVGVVTSFVLQSDDLDEIDWEWLGGDTSQVQTNYFSKGCTQTYTRGGFAQVNNPQSNFDTYTIDWTPQQLTWSINGNVVRTLTAASATGCDGYPQTPMQVKLGTWVAGGPNSPPGTVQWAGGYTDISKAPFIGYYQSIKITDYSNNVAGATEYVYGDQSGTSDSIKVITGGGSASGGHPSGSASTSAGAQSTMIDAHSSTGPASATMSSGGSVSGGFQTPSTTLLSVKTTDAASFPNSTTTGGSRGSTSGPSSGASITSSGARGAATTSTIAAGSSGAGTLSLSTAGVAVIGASLLMGLAM
ncbi:hypothetical protein P8C59_008748 [Phyllachora maydis]|uniref:Crh-like protein n=1 Tax=Phyllachora maydis TaxID=1825666 RepID=A0AAD9MHB2_9PEZI|nr:hypothetical protein P8C59_008748 [Phyllachora maydis]